MLQLLGDSSGGFNIVGEAKARAPYYPEATVDPAWVQVFYQYRGEDGQLVGALIPLGRFSPTARVSLPEDTRGLSRLSVFTVSYNSEGVPDVSRPEDGARLDVDLDRPVPSTGALGADEHVPEVTEAPTVAKADWLDEWIVFTPAPDDYGATLTDGEVRIAKADEPEIFTTWPVPVAPQHRVAQTPYPAAVSYRWRNQSAEDAGNGRGWSDWSPAAAAAELGAAVPPPPPLEVAATFVFDPHDSRAAVVSEVVSAE